MRPAWLSTTLLLAGLVVATVPCGAASDVDDPLVLLQELERAWKARSADVYLGLWEKNGGERAPEERQFALSHFEAEETSLQVQAAPGTSVWSTTVKVNVDVLSITEPRGRVEQHLFLLRRLPGGWAIVDRVPTGLVSGLVHLSLDGRGFRADGLVLRLEDFEIHMRRGSLFTSPESLGPTALVFVGDATVRFSPRPVTEQDQLRQFSGRSELREAVRAAFVRIDPRDLERVLSPAELVPDPEAARRLPEAQRFFAEHAYSAFLFDSALPGSPWWVFPGLGEGLVTFSTARRGTLTFAVNAQAEGVSLFSRGEKKQICLYPRADRSARYSEDDGRAADIVHHDLRVRFEPERSVLEGEDTLQMRLLAPVTTLRLRLDAGLKVHSVTSQEGGRHLFFRVRNQHTLVVALGPLALSEEISLTIRYGGVLKPTEVQPEVLQVFQEPEATDPEVFIDTPDVYANQTPWYPQTEGNDFAYANLRLDTPAGHMAITGGTRTSHRVEGRRLIQEYRQEQPGKYITVVVGRLSDVTSGSTGAVSLSGFGMARTRKDVSRVLGTASTILDFYAKLFGPCPYPTLNLVFAESMTPGGHSPPGMVILLRRPLQARRSLPDDPANFSDVPDFFLAHELAHQWWGQGVAGENYHERWLSEGVAHYAAALWTRHSQGERAFREVLERMRRWAFRENDEGPISLGHRLGHLKGNAQIFRAVVYDKGAYVLHMLHRIVGDEAFRAGLARFQSQYRFGKAGTDDLRQALESAAGKDLAAYFQAWIYDTALPELQVSRQVLQAGSGYRVVVSVRAANLPGPVPFEITLLGAGQDRDSRLVEVTPQGGTWTFEVKARPRKVDVNSDRGLLARIKT